MASKGVAPGSSRDYVRLMERWGFVQERGTGGHLIMQFDGKRVQVTAPKRPDRNPMPYRALRKAAEILGIDLNTFLRGPRRPKPAPAPQSEITTTRPCGCVVTESGTTPCDQHKQKEQEVAETTTDKKGRRRTVRAGKTSTPIAEVAWTRTNKGRQAVSEFGVEDNELGIETIDDDFFDDETAVESEHVEPEVVRADIRATADNLVRELNEGALRALQVDVEEAFGEALEVADPEIVRLWQSATNVLIGSIIDNLE